MSHESFQNLRCTKLPSLFPSFPSPFPFPSSSPYPYHYLPLEVCHLSPARGSGEQNKLPSRRIHFDTIYTQNCTSDDHRQTGGMAFGQKNGSVRPIPKNWMKLPDPAIEFPWSEPRMTSRNSSEKIRVFRQCSVLSRQLTLLRCCLQEETLVEEGLMSHQTHYRSYRGRVFTGQMTQPTVSKH